MRRVLALLLAVVVGLAFARAVQPALAGAPACHEMHMESPGPAQAPGAASHGLHGCCLFCAGVELRAPLEHWLGIAREEAVSFSVVTAALPGRTMPPAVGPPKRFV